MIETEIEIINKLGLHARAAAKLVNLASGFESEIQLQCNGRTINGKSIMGVMMLAAAKGAKVLLMVDGNDEQTATDELTALVKQRFGEDE